MYCPECGSINEDNARFCEVCGYDLTEDIYDSDDDYDEEPLPNEEEEKKPKSNKNNNKWIAAAIAVSVLSCAIIILAVTGVGGQMLTNLTAGTAMESEESKAMEELYQNALNLMEAEKYEEAIAEFAQIDNGHYRFKDAKRNIELCSQYYADSIIAELDTAEEDEYYKLAYDALEKANKGIKKDNLALQKQMKKTQEQYKDFLLSQVTAYKKDKEYAKAIVALNNYDRKIIPDGDKAIAAEMETLTTEFTKFILAEVDNYLKLKEYGAALSCLDSGLEVLEDNPELIAKKEEVNETAATEAEEKAKAEAEKEKQTEEANKELTREEAMELVRGVYGEYSYSCTNEFTHESKSYYVIDVSEEEGGTVITQIFVEKHGEYVGEGVYSHDGTKEEIKFLE